MPEHTVFDFDTVRWMQKHHNKKKVSIRKVSELVIRQLRQLFDSLDEDNSGTIEISEILRAMEGVGSRAGQKHVLHLFRHIDSDGSGSIEFEEFLSVMTSGLGDQQFFQLNDQMEAQKYNIEFFAFVLAHRRTKILASIESESATDGKRYASFHKLFSVPDMPSGLAPGQASNFSVLKKNYSDTRKRIFTTELRKQRSAATRRSKVAASKLVHHRTTRCRTASAAYDQKVNRMARREALSLLGSSVC